jgi:hypothetical protein
MNRERREERDRLARQLLHGGSAKNWADAKAGADQALRCGKPTFRDGLPCQARKVPGKRWCRWHGGAHTGPKSPEFRQYLRQRMIVMNRSDEARERSRRLIGAVNAQRWGLRIEAAE